MGESEARRLGQTELFQVENGTSGAGNTPRVSNRVNIAGRLMVLMPAPQQGS